MLSLDQIQQLFGQFPNRSTSLLLLEVRLPVAHNTRVVSGIVWGGLQSARDFSPLLVVVNALCGLATRWEALTVFQKQL